MQDSPSAVIRKLYMACNAGEYSKVDDLLSTDLKKMVHEGLGVAAGGIKGICDENSRNGTITSIDVKTETIRGEGATVIIDIHFKDNSVKSNDDNQLVKENGAWKVSK